MRARDSCNYQEEKKKKTLSIPFLLCAVSCLLWAKTPFNSIMSGRKENKYSEGLTRTFLYTSGTRTELVIYSKSPSGGQKGFIYGRSVKLIPAQYCLFTQHVWFKIVRLFLK